jgi:hypothetical protein
MPGPLHRQDPSVPRSGFAAGGQGYAVFLRPAHEGRQFLLRGGLDNGVGYRRADERLDQAGDLRDVVPIERTLPAVEGDTGLEKAFQEFLVSNL